MAAIGSRGDIAPLTGLAAGLRDAGHEVTVAGHAVFADLITECGLTFREMPTNLDIDMTDPNVDREKAVRQFASPNGVRATGNGLIEALRDEPADVLLLGQLTEFAGFPLAEAKGIPAVGVRFQPMSATAAHPPAAMGARSFGPRGNRFAADAGAWLADRVLGGVVSGFRRDLGLPDVPVRTLRHRRTAAEWLVLHGYSPTVSPRPADWRPGLEVTGYWWPPRPRDWTPPAELLDFLASGPPPVFVGFGSLVNTAEHGAHMSELVAAALREAGVRGIVQAGWLQLDVREDDILTVGDVPHDWLFPRMAAVVHHCGAGTTAAGLLAGVPAVGVPLYSDQPFWAERLRALGVSPATIPYPKLTASSLAAAIRAATGDPAMRALAGEVAARIAEENGVATAVRALENHLGATATAS
ncbi:glycosyltransferase [Nocardia stercoris]|uniref:Glycosyltransferase n=2 Tax=Nocardia stercoris TaxID=2483361 RepID=A0A3M2KVC2_9NOCA|nr:glycosyltransferase [Nocardia stercoris]